MVLNNISRFLAFQEIPEDERSYAHRLSSFGHALLDKGQFGPALERFDSAISAQPNNLSAWLGRAQALRGLNCYSPALRSLNHVETLSPAPQAELLLEKAELWVKLRKFNLALKACEAALALSPHCLRAYMLRLSMLWRLGRLFQLWSSAGQWAMTSKPADAINSLIPVVAPVE